jgi:hypothetical protein
MYTRLELKPTVPHFDMVTERCGGCDGHWKCYCVDEWHISITDTDMKQLEALMEKLNTKQLPMFVESGQFKVIGKFLQEIKKERARRK